ncbi:MAG TPA: protein kinase [Candidatus Eisenbacteria bacterium]|jgi:serine/threonine-protein kinase
MTFAPGTKLGPYEILEPLGAGGMGEVYRARDPRLSREVAIKALPDAFAADPDRLARFEREARLLASLSHPHVAAIHGVEESGGDRFLILELVQGETLEARLARGALPLDEALEVGRQIASALEAAHEAGVIHRDLKPGNVMLTPAGEAKVLDFGLAKGVAQGARSSSQMSQSPTLAATGTEAGIILGTAAYMSPEQARGKALDKRTDIWSFGCVLYECLTGRQPFQGETISDLIARILEREPEWSALPGPTPTQVRELVHRCLEKDAKKRLRDIGDARIELEEVLARRTESGRIPAGPRAEAAQRNTARVAIAAALVALVAGAALWAWLGPAGRGRRGVNRVAVDFPPQLRILSAYFDLDGASLVCFGAPRAQDGEEEPPVRLYVRRLDSYEMKPLPGTEGVQTFGRSPDGKWVIFVAPVAIGAPKLRLTRVALDGSSPATAIGSWKSSWNSLIVLRNGDLVTLADQGRSLARLHADGSPAGPPLPLLTGGLRGQLTLGDLLPGDRAVFVKSVSYGARGWFSSIGVADLKTGRVKFLAEDAGSPRYSRTGHLVFSRGDVLLAAPFDLGHLEIHGTPAAIVDGLLTDVALVPARFDLARNGALLYRPGGLAGERRRLAIVDANGNLQPFLPERRPYGSPSIARHGNRFAVGVTNADGLDEVWISDLARPELRRLVATPEADCTSPVISPDGARVAFERRGRSEQDGLYLADTEGRRPPWRIATPESAGVRYQSGSWAPDGSALMVERRGPDGTADIVRVRAAVPGESLAKPEPILATPYNETSPWFSANGRWITYTSDETGRNEVYVCPLGPDGRLAGRGLRVSREGGYGSQWDPDGRRVTYAYAMPSRLISVPIRLEPALAVGEPSVSLDWQKLRISNADMLPDGRFLAVIKGEDEKDEMASVNLVLNWTDELIRRVPKR